MIKQLSYSILFLFFCAVITRAQDLTVASFTPSTSADASVHPVNDNNGQACALVKVYVTDEMVDAKGPFVIRQDGSNAVTKHGPNEYWVYLANGAKNLTVVTRNYKPLQLWFRDYNVPMLQSKVTYHLSLNLPQMGGSSQVQTGKNYLILSVTPTNAIVHIDGQLESLDPDGALMSYLSYGSHTYQVEAKGYAPQSGTVQISSGERTTLNIQLTSTMARLNISSTTAGTRIYVNNNVKGTGSWNGSLAAGSYLLEGRLDGHRPWSQSVTLAENDNRSVTIPALTAILGGLNVMYRPINAEIFLDGNRIGTSPNVFSNIPVGSHRLTVKKSGYTEATVTVSVTEGKVTDVNGTLQPATAATTGSSYNTSSSTSSTASETFTVGGVTLKMIRVDGGTFTMGATSEQGSYADSDEKPTHRVTLSTYYIGETEVTQALWQAVMGTTVSQQRDKANKEWPLRGEEANYPMYYVSWEDCQNFVRELNRMTGKNFRLPTEAEWEFAARGGNKNTGCKYSGSNALDDVGWYWKNSGDKYLSGTDGDWNLDKIENNNGRTHPVKTKKPNELGIYDMSGNVWEWCQDWKGDYSSAPQTNPTGPTSGSRRVNRGGSWFDGAGSSRVSYRNDDAPASRFNHLGLRLALSKTSTQTNTSEHTYSDHIKVQGHVYDAKDKDGVIGAEVFLLKDGKKTTTATISDFDGNFTIAVPAIGKHSLKISYAGYKDSKVDIDKNNNQKLEIPMRY